MAISKIILNGVTQVDLTQDTVAASNLIAPNTAHGADGEAIVGTATQGITPTGTLNITENGTYDVTNYASTNVNISSGNTYTITLTNSGDSGNAYIRYNNIKYYSSGDTIEVPENATIQILVQYGGSNYIYVNNTLVAGSFGNVANYTYTITTNIEIRFSLSQGSSSAYVTEVSDIQPLEVTTNGTYTASGTTKGYSPVTVNVSSGGGSSWTKIAETSYQVSTTSTSAATVATWETGHSELWTSDKIVYVRIRDTAGKRAGYFYGTDTWFMNTHPANNSTSTSATTGNIMAIWACSSSGTYTNRYGYESTGYGVYADTFYNDGRIRIRKRYNSNYSRTIDGTYKVEVYLLDPPTGAPIFT